MHFLIILFFVSAALTVVTAAVTDIIENEQGESAGTAVENDDVDSGTDGTFSTRPSPLLPHYGNANVRVSRPTPLLWGATEYEYDDNECLTKIRNKSNKRKRAKSTSKENVPLNQRRQNAIKSSTSDD